MTNILTIPQNFADLKSRPFDLREDVRRWCQTFLSGKYHIRLLPIAKPEQHSFNYRFRRQSESLLCKTIIVFQKENDMTAFQLRWMP